MDKVWTRGKQKSQCSSTFSSPSSCHKVLWNVIPWKERKGAPPGPGAPFLARIQGMSIPRVSSCSSLNTVDRKGNVYCRVSSDNITFFFSKGSQFAVFVLALKCDFSYPRKTHFLFVWGRETEYAFQNVCVCVRACAYGVWITCVCANVYVWVGVVYQRLQRTLCVESSSNRAEFEREVILG